MLILIMLFFTVVSSSQNIDPKENSLEWYKIKMKTFEIKRFLLLFGFGLLIN